MRSSINFSLPRCSSPICISVFSIISPLSCKISLKTPWAAGCCGPKFKLIVFIVFRLIFLLSIIGFQLWKILLFRIFLFFTLVFSLERIFSLFFISTTAYTVCLSILFFILFFLKNNSFNTLNALKYLNSFFFF